MFKLKTGHQPGVYVPLRALFLVNLKKCTVLELVSDSFLEQNIPGFLQILICLQTITQK